MTERIKALRFHPVGINCGDQVGYAVERVAGSFLVSFARAGKTGHTRVAFSRAKGELLVFDSPFVADHYIRVILLPLYSKKAAG